LDAASYAQITGLISDIEQLNGCNYVSWKEKLEITLALLDLNYALNNETPKELEEGSQNFEALQKEYNDEKAKWELSNRKCLMVIKSSIVESIRVKRPPIREDLKMLLYQSQEADNTFITSDGISPYNFAR
jgi:hypothetical protein